MYTYIINLLNTTKCERPYNFKTVFKY